MKPFLSLMIGLLVAAPSAFAQDEGPRFGAEFISTFWVLSPDGSISAGDSGRVTNGIDLKSDLGVGRRLNNLMKATLKFGATHRVVIEGARYRFAGTQDVSIPFRFSGTEYSTQDTIFSKPAVDYLFAGYARDLFARELDRLGIEAGVSYLRGKGDIESLRTGISASHSRSLALPLVGLDYVRNLTGIADRFEISGDLSGMSAGSRGHYLKGSARIGVRVWTHLVVHVGYGVIDLKAKRDQDRLDVRFHGPTITLDFRDR